MARKPAIPAADDDRMTSLMRHYNHGVQDENTRRTRNNGWNEIINAYMGKLPANWPYNALVTDPRIRTTILEKTARLLNAKLQGRLLPREDGDVVKARINNAILDFQWDEVEDGGSMIEKVALADQVSRVYGAAFVLVYWDVVRNTNEIKVLDPRDLFFDGAATHIRNARWVQVREWTTFDKLEERGYDVAKFKGMATRGEISNNKQDVAFMSQVKVNRGLENRVGEYDNPRDPIVEVVTEWTPEKCTIFLPRVGAIISDTTNPYKHGNIPLAMLRYYPLGDDIYGESEVESVMPLQRAINATLCGYIDQVNLAMRPPLKINPTGTRIETIEYGPGAKWIMSDINSVQEMQFSQEFISSFNATYPALVAAFNSAMGDQSLGLSNNLGQSGFTDKTATEVVSNERQQNNRDQYNQLYLGEFLKDIMMMWLSNNKQYLFDDPRKSNFILKIVGKDNIKALQQMKLDEADVPPEAMNTIAQTVAQNPNAVSDGMLQGIMQDVAIPTNPVITNPNEQDPANYDVKRKLTVHPDGMAADLYVQPSDLDGEYDYVPDVKSMSAGAGVMMQQARDRALQYALDPNVTAQLQMQGEMLKMKELLVATFEDAGYKDAEGLFETVQQPTGQQTQDKPSVSIKYSDLPPEGQVQAAAEAGIQLTPQSIINHQQLQSLNGSGAPGAGAGANPAPGNPGMAQPSQAVPPGLGA